MTFSGQQVDDIEKTGDHVSVLAYLGAELGHQKQHLEYARRGATSLVVYAPSEAEVPTRRHVFARFEMMAPSLLKSHEIILY